MDKQAKLLRLLSETFTEQEILDIALYIVSAHAVAEVAQDGIMLNKEEVRGLPPQVIELAYKYDSALTNNEFFLKHYTVIRAFTIIDKIRVAAANRMFLLAEKEKEKSIYKAVQETIHTKLDSLVMLAFLWKGYDFAVDFMSKVRLIVEFSSPLESYLEKKINECDR